MKSHQQTKFRREIFRF